MEKINAVALLDGEFWAVEDASPYNFNHNFVKWRSEIAPTN